MASKLELIEDFILYQNALISWEQNKELFHPEEHAEIKAKFEAGAQRAAERLLGLS